MRKEKVLIKVLRDLANLLSEESEKNTEFAIRLETILTEAGIQIGRSKSSIPNKRNAPIIDVYNEWNARGESEFRLWLKDQPLAEIRLIIRQQDFDPTRKTAKWKESEKLSDFVVRCLNSRLSRGSAFISSVDNS